MVLYHAADLLWATRIKKTGEAVGVSCRPVRSVEMLNARLADSDVRGLVVDLDSPEVSLELIRAMRARLSEASTASVRIFAFGPHVAVELFEQARAAGANEVLARGAFDRRISEVLTLLDAEKAT
jgi:hypothetical protein